MILYCHKTSSAGLKNPMVGCIYRHPSGSISIEDVSKEYLEPVLLHISHENKICSIVGDFNIDLLKLILVMIIILI